MPKRRVNKRKAVPAKRNIKINAHVFSGYPAGMIMPFYSPVPPNPDGTFVPLLTSDWKWCNGENGTPDLRGRFLRGGHAGEIGSMVGQPHTHQVLGGTSTAFPHSDGYSHGNRRGPDPIEVTGLAHFHDINLQTQPAEVLPPSFNIYFVMSKGR